MRLSGTGRLAQVVQFVQLRRRTRAYHTSWHVTTKEYGLNPFRRISSFVSPTRSLPPPYCYARASEPWPATIIIIFFGRCILQSYRTNRLVSKNHGTSILTRHPLFAVSAPIAQHPTTSSDERVRASTLHFSPLSKFAVTSTRAG
jgi:hypothetical protein